MPLKLIPESFAELIVLCLFWEFWPLKPAVTNRGGRKSTGGSCVGHVLKILLNMGVVTVSQAKLIRHSYDGQPYQRMLYSHCAVISGNKLMKNRNSWILCRQYLSIGKPVALYDLVRDQKIELLEEGARIAESLVMKYMPALSREAYLAEADRIEKNAVKTQAVV